ncbi:MAG TPA: RNA polymerase sigma factor [Solirubrobacteraceae bacterium]|jgi:RNA polymerase sigma-70 factor (ECF subfamily)|nr:RNA polymerase sigma factor [Solirubrobacteraceae bacterium]
MADPPERDAELLARIGRGDQEAFAIFYRAHLDGVVAFLARRVPGREQAFDLAAETFAAVVVGARSYAADGPVAAWLYGIARNKLRESLRRGRVEDAARRRLGMEPVVLDDADLDAVGQRAGAGGELLDAALEALPELTRRALVARVVDERDYREIARDLDCSEQVVRQRVHRGLARLRTGLEEA